VLLHALQIPIRGLHAAQPHAHILGQAGRVAEILARQVDGKQGLLALVVVALAHPGGVLGQRAGEHELHPLVEFCAEAGLLGQDLALRQHRDGAEDERVAEELHRAGAADLGPAQVDDRPRRDTRQVGLHLVDFPLGPGGDADELSRVREGGGAEDGAGDERGAARGQSVIDATCGVRVDGRAVDEELAFEIEVTGVADGLDNLLQSGVVADADEDDVGGPDGVGDGGRDGAVAQRLGEGGCAGGGPVVEDQGGGEGAFLGDVLAHALVNG